MITDSDDPDTAGSLSDTIEIDDGSNVAFIYNASQKAATPPCQVIIYSSYELRILPLNPMKCGLFTKMYFRTGCFVWQKSFQDFTSRF